MKPCSTAATKADSNQGQLAKRQRHFAMEGGRVSSVQLETILGLPPFWETLNPPGPAAVIPKRWPAEDHHYEDLQRQRALRGPEGPVHPRGRQGRERDLHLHRCRDQERGVHRFWKKHDMGIDGNYLFGIVCLSLSLSLFTYMYIYIYTYLIYIYIFTYLIYIYIYIYIYI